MSANGCKSPSGAEQATPKRERRRRSRKRGLFSPAHPEKWMEATAKSISCIC